MEHQEKGRLIPKPQRLMSLDALRGFDMFWIVSGEGIFHGFANGVMHRHQLARNAENWQIGHTAGLNSVEHFAVTISNQLHHSVWNGFTFYDLIFPLFIFMAGASMPYSFGRQFEVAGANIASARKNIYRSLVKRTIILVMLGVVVNGGLQFAGWENTRFASVLARIAISCFLGAVIFLQCNLKAQIAWFSGILLAYWAAMAVVPVPGFGAGELTPEGNLAAWMDRELLPGKLHRAVYDPEGLLTNIPAACSALLGIFTGQFLRFNSPQWGMQKKCAAMALSGLILLLLGGAWGFVFPINKTLWSSSYVLYAGGWSLLLLAAFYGLVDVKHWQQWCQPFVWMGMNSILIYVAAHGAIDFLATSDFLFGGLIHKLPVIFHEGLRWTGVAILQFAGLYFLYKNKIYLKV